MGKRYTSPITATLTPDNWKDRIKLDNMSLEDMIDVMGDARQMEKLGKALNGYMKEAIGPRMPEDETEYSTSYWDIELVDRERQGNPDKDKIIEEMGEDWWFDHLQDPTEYVQMNCKRRED